MIFFNGEIPCIAGVVIRRLDNMPYGCDRYSAMNKDPDFHRKITWCMVSAVMPLLGLRTELLSE